MSHAPIKLETLRELVSAGAVKSATILGQKGGYAVLANIGMQDRSLVIKYGEVRMFASTDTAVKALRDAGLARFTLDVTNYQEGLLRAPRPDVRKRAQDAATALEHTRWMHDQVAPVLEQVKSGKATLHSHDDVWSRVESHARTRLAERDAAPKAAPARRASRPGKKVSRRHCATRTRPRLTSWPLSITDSSKIYPTRSATCWRFAIAWDSSTAPTCAGTHRRP